MQALKVIVEDKEKAMSLRLIGSIDEEAALENIKVGTSKDLIIDIGEVNFMNSYGGREWIKWTHKLNSNRNLRFLNCPSVFLEYVNMIDGFIPSNGTIESFKIPYYCESCNKVTNRNYESKSITDVSKDVALNMTCSHCKKNAEIDVVVPNFFKFLR